jgi:hypothetical protein
MTDRPVATWMRKEDDVLRTAAVSGETIATTSKLLCRSEKAVRPRAVRLRIEFAQQRRSLRVGFESHDA